MISLGSRDGRRREGLDGRSEMEEIELEEGEACSFQEDDDRSIDPDVTFSYIDKKIQDVLGHFKKDFEAGLSAENLGAKFGGYGSFLPVHQRSPVWSHTKSPPKAQSSYIPRSPNTVSVEGGHHNFSAQSELPHQTKRGPSTAGSESSQVYKAPSLDDSVRRVPSTRYMQSAEKFTPKSTAAERSANLPDQRTLKVKIKVGSDNLSTKNNAAIYNGLGLDVSPSSSFDDSPAKSPGSSSHGIADAYDESPTLILEIMTSFPIDGGHLLSPLPDGLLQLTNKEKLLPYSSILPTSKMKGGFMVQGVYHPEKGVNKLSEEGIMKTAEKTELPVEGRRGSAAESSENLDLLLKKEAESDTLACHELISNALKLPLLSNSPGTAVIPHGGSPASYFMSESGQRDALNEKSSMASQKDKSLVLPSSENNGWNQTPNGKALSAGKHNKGRKQHSSDVPSRPRKGGYQGDIMSSSDVSVGKEMHSSERSKMFLNSENGDRKENSSRKSMSPEKNGMKYPPGKAHSSSGGKKKPKKRQVSGSQGTCGPKEGQRSATSIHGYRKHAEYNNSNDTNEVDGFSVQKGISKVRDTYKEFFGDMDDLGDNPVGSPDILGSGLKASEMAEDYTDAFDSNVKDNFRLEESSGLSNSGMPSEGVLNLAPPPENRALISDVPPADVADDWVCCDKCQKWRLLPLGTKVDSHSEWTCSMMSWLPGMNRCSFSEEETTKALQALHNLPSNQKGHPDPMDNSKSGPALVDALQLSRDHRESAPHGSKKHRLKEVSSSSYQVGHYQLPDSMMKTIKSTSVTKSDAHHSNSADTIVDANGHKKKDRRQSLGSYSDGGISNDLKIKRGKGKMHPTTTSKKRKAATLHLENGDLASAGGQSNEMLDHMSSCYQPTDGAGEDHLSKHLNFTEREYYTSDSKHVKKLEPEVEESIDIPPSEGKKSDDSNSAVKKRKMPDLQNPLDSAVTSKKMNSDDLHVKVKKATVLKSDDKKSSTTEEKVRSEKKLRTAKDQRLGSESESGTIRAPNNLDQSVPSIRKLMAAEPVVAATSSSSKVSGSSKIKSELQEATGSPVNSVSSSPVRTSTADVYSPAKKDHQNVHFSNRDGRKLCSDIKNDRQNDVSGNVRINPTDGVSDHMFQKIPLLDTKVINEDNAKIQISNSLKLPSDQSMGSHVDTLQKGTRYPSEAQGVDRCLGAANDATEDANDYDFNRSRLTKLDESSLHSKDRSHKFKSDPDKGKVKLSESCGIQGKLSYCEDKTRDIKIKTQDKFSSSIDGAENDYTTKNNFGGITGSGCNRSKDRLNPTGHDDLVVKADTISRHHTRSSLQQDKEQECSEKGSSRKLDIDKSERTVSMSGGEKSHQLASSILKKNEVVNRCPRPCHGNVGDTSTNICEDAAALKEPVLDKRSDNPNKTVCNTSKHPMSNGHRGRNSDAPSPNRRDSSSQAATNAVKEAKDLKHLADRMKNAGSTAESTGLYFQAALKFLHGAALLESSNQENPKHGEVSQSKLIYSSTAKLCEFCAHEYERLKDMAAAALAYKCMEVAYMKVVYSSRATASRDRHDLQAVAQIVPPGESPSSSASDLDNSNNPACGDKVVQVRGVSSPQIMGNHVIASRNRPGFTRLLNFAQDVNFAMDASRKSRIAYAAAATISTEQARVKEAISSIKRALDFNFHDVEGLLRLVRLAMEAISH